MSARERLQFSIVIAAPAKRVYEALIGPASFKEWTAPFMEGSYFEGSWQQGARIRFLGPGGGVGMVAEIAENRPHEFISIRHLGFVAKGVEDTESEAVCAWAPAYENYTLLRVVEGTQLVVDMDAFGDMTDFMTETWPKALARLKALCEGEGGA
ncbi:SRPBCC domain-containing protein [bacterium]|nr:SRPBCC domain-containing protein [bacterium]